MAKKNMSFLPEEYLERRAVRRTNITCMLLFVIVMGGLVTGYLFTDWKRQEVRQQQAMVNQQFTEAARRLEQLEQLQTRKEQMLRKANVTSALVERVPRSLLLAELINNMPRTLSLLEFELETKKIRDTRQPRTSLERRRQEMERDQDKEQVRVPETEMGVILVGVAPTDVEVAQFMTALSQHELFHDLSLQYSEETTIEQQKMRRFQIAMKVSRDVDFEQMEPTQRKRVLEQNPMSDEVQIELPENLRESNDTVAPVSDTQQQD
ncbi:MAG: PilN domain-containing protein [Phycisphaeraceae bacterium]